MKLLIGSLFFVAVGVAYLILLRGDYRYKAHTGIIVLLFGLAGVFGYFYSNTLSHERVDYSPAAVAARLHTTNTKKQKSSPIHDRVAEITAEYNSQPKVYQIQPIQPQQPTYYYILDYDNNVFHDIICPLAKDIPSDACETRKATRADVLADGFSPCEECCP